MYTSDSLEDSDLQFIEIQFDTSTYDKVVLDKKMTIEAQLSLIGGTMGLLTGFSILSGVEIIYILHCKAPFVSEKLQGIKIVISPPKIGDIYLCRPVEVARPRHRRSSIAA